MRSLVEPALEKRSASDDLPVDSVASRRRILISIFGVAFAAVGSVVFGWIADLTFGRDVWQAFVLGNFELVIGTPMAAALAFCIVMIYYGSFAGPLKMKIGLLEIEGPAGPILLWAVCFAVVVWGINLLSKAT
jgi:hypothetical protein